MQNLNDLAQEAYIYTFPMVFTLSEVAKHTSDPQTSGAAPINHFGYYKKLAGPQDKFVTINNDTIYSMLQADLTAEPLVIHVPDTAGRYIVLQFIDAWTNNFAYVGQRATGTAEASYLIVGPNWQGEIPANLTVIHAPTNVFTVLSRIAISGESELPVIYALQSQLTVTPLSNYLSGTSAPEGHFGDWSLPATDPNVPDELKFWEQARVWMQAFPPAAPDQAYEQRFAPLGLLDKTSPYVNPNTDLRVALITGEEAGKAAIEQHTKEGLEFRNQWSYSLHGFDYNLDFFELGTNASPEWRYPDREKSYLNRAGAARVGLWGNHGYEAAYSMTFRDADGQPLVGTNSYIWHLAGQPPVGAFWSITMYDIPNYYLVDNPINRYSIGDRTPGLKINADGSLDIYIQHDSPGADKESNWLPAPAGPFRPVMRMYIPKEPILNGSYWPPPIQKR